MCTSCLCVSTTFIKSHEGFSVIVHESLKPLCTADEASNPLAENPGFRVSIGKVETQTASSSGLGWVCDGFGLTIAG